MNNLLSHKQIAAALDHADPLKHFRSRFFNTSDVIYLDGNSLGLLPLATSARLRQVVEYQWGNRLIRAWNEHWLQTPKRIAEKIARLIGAQADEVFVGDSTSINLFKIAYGVLKLQEGRTVILSDDLNFPSDFYVLQGLINSYFHHHDLKILASQDGVNAPEEEMLQAIDGTTALVCLSHVAFKSAYMYDMANINAKARSAGAKVIWDLSHAVGSVPLTLNDWGAEFAVGCTYKYLNGGPGAPAFLYVRKDLQSQIESAIWAWFGHASPFSFEQQYRPRKDIWKFSAGTPPVLSMAAIEPGLDLLLEAGLDSLRKKSLSLTTLFRQAFAEQLKPLGFEWASPTAENQRGSHVSIRHPEGYRICKAMISPENDALPIIPDFRSPDIIRLGFAPLFNKHCEVIEASERIAQIVESETYLRFDATLDAVT